jgi:hypothetical protein
LPQSNVDNRPHVFERFGQFLALILRGRTCFLAIAGKFIAQAAIDQFQTFHQFRFDVVFASTARHQNDDGNDNSAAD